MKIKTTLDKFNEGLREIKKKGGLVSYELLDSTIEGKASISGVDARFEFNQGTLTIDIIDAPFFAPTSMIEDKIRAFFAA